MRFGFQLASSASALPTGGKSDLGMLHDIALVRVTEFESRDHFGMVLADNRPLAIPKRRLLSDDVVVYQDRPSATSGLRLAGPREVRLLRHLRALSAA
jgi:hypothetical protein